MGAFKYMHGFVEHYYINLNLLYLCICKCDTAPQYHRQQKQIYLNPF